MLVVDVNMIKLQVANTINTVAIILVQVLFLSVINAEYWDFGNATDYGPTWKLVERFRRAPFHRYIPADTLLVTIRDGCKDIHITWKRVGRFLFNENLPIYLARMNSWGANHKKSDVMKKIGKIIKYHDITQRSSAIYVENTDSLSGVVGQSYEIIRLPVDQLPGPIVVGGPYVRKLRNHLLHGERKVDTTKESQHSELTGSGDTAAGSSQNSQGLATPIYVETLLFITYDVFQFAQSKFRNLALENIVMNHFLLFNAVDMIYNMLPKTDFDIFINLAGIIVEEEDGVFSHILKYEPLTFNNRAELINDGKLFNLFEQYTKDLLFPFPRDSFDLILVTTGRKLMNNGKQYYGWNSAARDIFWDKRMDNRAPSVPSIMVKLDSPYVQYPYVVQFIGFALGIHVLDDCKKGITAENGQKCYAIMQNFNPACTNCLSWSEESVGQLKTYFTKNRNRCFLLNKPRSLYPPDTTIISLPPCVQCTCFGYVSYDKEKPDICPLFIPAEDCSKPLQCKYWNFQGVMQTDSTILPIDGTPCGENKVCWNEECTGLSGTAATPLP